MSLPTPDPVAAARKVPLDDSVSLARSLLVAAHTVMGAGNAVQIDVRLLDADGAQRVVGMLVWEQGDPPVSFTKILTNAAAQRAEREAAAERVQQILAARAEREAKGKWWRFWK